ncbi:MAG: carbohydrate porin [Silvanigrellaceae bacterium]
MKQHLRTLSSCISLFSLVHAGQALCADSKEQPFEFHSYGRLGFSTNEKLTDAGRDQGDGAFGLPTSRHVRDLNYLRIQLLGNMSTKAKFNLEAQFDNLAHQTNNWNGAGLNLRNAYFQLPLNSESEGWVGARRLEFEDVRLFDKFPLSDTTFYGAGFTTPIAGSATTVAIGFKNLENSPLLVAKDPNNPAADNDSVVTQRRDTSLFVRHDISLDSNMAIRPTLILSRTGKYFQNGAPLDNYSTVLADKSGIASNETPKPVVTGKLGAVLSHWGNEGWGNHFVWAEQRSAAGQVGSTDKDTIYGLATSGDYEGLSDSDVGLMYSAIVQVTQYKNAQPKYSLKDNAYVANGDSTSKRNTLVAVGLQPVYYATPNLHLALDLNHTLSTKVGAEFAKPNMTFITPIVRYATNKNALATPQLFTSVTYGIYESKARLSSTGTPSKTSLTTQTGCEFWF